MKKKYKILLAIMLCLLLAGCSDSIDSDFNHALFKPDRYRCWPCQVYVQTFFALSNVMDKALGIICENAYFALVWGLMFWLMYKVFPWVVSFTPPDLKKDIPVLAKVGAKTIVVSIVLTHPEFFYTFFGTYILQPISDIFLKVSEFILISPASIGVSLSQYAQTEESLLSKILNWFGPSNFNWSDAFSQEGVSEALNQFENAFNRSVLPNGNELPGVTTDRMFGQMPMQLQSVIWQIYSALWSGIGLVFQLFATKNILAWLSAFLLCWYLLKMLFIIPLSFVDAFVRLGMSVLFMPLVLVTWVFPIKTFEGLAGKLIQMMFGAFFDILFNCIYVAFLVSVLRVYTAENLADVFSSDYQTSESGLRTDGAFLNTEFIIFFMLIYTVCSLFESVGDVSGHFFEGAGSKSTFAGTVKKFGHLAFTLTKATAMMVLSGGSNWSGFAKVKDEAVKNFWEGVADMNAAQEKEYWDNEHNDKGKYFGNWSKAYDKEQENRGKGKDK